MAQTVLTGIVKSTKMNGSVVVEVTRKVPHKLYKKLITKSKKYIVGSRGMDIQVGQKVSMSQTRKMAGNKHFTIVKEGGE